MKASRMIAAWRIVDKYGDTTHFGIEEEPHEFPLDHLPGGWEAERNIDEVQNTMCRVHKWKDEGYKFEYQYYVLSDNLNIEKEATE